MKTAARQAGRRRAEVKGSIRSRTNCDVEAAARVPRRDRSGRRACRRDSKKLEHVEKIFPPKLEFNLKTFLDLEREVTRVTRLHRYTKVPVLWDQMVRYQVDLSERRKGENGGGFEGHKYLIVGPRNRSLSPVGLP